MSKEINLAAVHDGTFHTDEVFAIAILQLINPKLKVIRTREPDEYNKADIRIDIGKKYNPKTNNFDHHQKEGAGKRRNGIAYASAGLIWKHFGKQLVKEQDAWDYLDQKLFQPIDAGDNGVSVFKVTLTKPYLLSDVISMLNPKWQEKNKDPNLAFEKAVALAKQILHREIESTKGINEIRKTVLAAVKKSNGKYIVLDEFVPWRTTLIERTNVKYVVYKSANNQWRVKAVPKRVDGFELRKPLPKKWGGLEHEELAKLTGIKDAIFCHRKLFNAGAKTKEGAIRLAELALKN